MADPNSAPVGSDAGTLTAPDESRLFSDIAGIESHYEPRVEESEARAQKMSEASVGASQDVATFAEKAAGETTAGDAELQAWLDHTPTRQASYATSMHAAPVLAILTALGGKFTRLNGLQMLSATKGIVEGLNEASEQKYSDALQAWQASFQKMREHQQRLMDAHRMMLTAYQGRADAYQKAAESARRMTGDILDDKQRQISQKIDLFKAQATAWDRLQRVNISRDALKERELKDIHQVAHWKELEKKAERADPQLKLQLANEKARWQNAKSQLDELMKRRGQINSNLTMPEAAKDEALQSIDNATTQLQLMMDQAQSNADALLQQHQSGAPGRPAPLTPGTTTPPAAAPASPRAGTIPRPGQNPAGDASADVSPQRRQILEQHKGVTVTFGDGTWIMENDGSIHKVQ